MQIRLPELRLVFLNCTNLIFDDFYLSENLSYLLLEIKPGNKFLSLFMFLLDGVDNPQEAIVVMNHFFIAFVSFG